MKKQNPTNTTQDKSMKFAEAGVLFVIVLALTIFVGVRLTHHNQANDNTPTVAVTTAPIAHQIAAATDEPEPAKEVVIAAATTPEPLEVPESSATLDVSPPRVVTYAAAEKAYLDGDYEEAVDQFDDYTVDHPDNAWGYYMLGLSEWKADDLDAAAEAFVTALDIKPDHVKSLINYGRVLLAQDRLPEARVQIELALAEAPSNVAANRLYSRLAHNEGHLEDAAEGYLKVLQIKSDDVWSLNNLGLVRIQQEQFALAIPPLARAASLETGIACIQNNLGIALERSGYFGQAMAAYEQAIEQGADTPMVENNRDRVATLAAAAETDETVDLASLAASFMGSEIAPSTDPADPIGTTAEIDLASATDPQQP